MRHGLLPVPQQKRKGRGTGGEEKLFSFFFQ